MQIYKSKPVYVTAEQWDGEPHRHVYMGAGNATVQGKNGDLHIYKGDWIVEEPDNTGYYPLDPAAFAKEYEPA
jgi:hypothetical protein